MWAGISVKGATSVCIFEGNMDSLVYQNILSRFLLPFVCEKYPMGYRFMQDNDPKHTSRSTQEWLERNEVNWWPTPPESPVSLILKFLLANVEVVIVELSLLLLLLLLDFYD